MDVTSALVAGAATGIAGALVPAFLFEWAHRGKASPSVTAGIAGILVSFLAQTVAVLVVFLASRNVTLHFGCAMVGTFLAFWGIESIRAWRVAQRGASAGRRDA